MFIVKYFKYCLGLFDKTYLLSRYIKFVKNSFLRFEVSLIYFYLENISVSSISIQYTKRGRYARGIQLNHIDSSFNSVHAIFSTATLMTRQVRTHIHTHIHTYTHVQADVIKCIYNAVSYFEYLLIHVRCTYDGTKRLNPAKWYIG